MKKIIYRLAITILLVVFLSILYLSTVGIKTKKLNTKIVSEIQKIEPDFKLKINEVGVKLNPFTLAIDAKTVGTDLIYRNKIIKVEHIKSSFSIKSIIKKQFALSRILISTKSIPIKDLISFIRLFSKEPKLLIAEHFVSNGYVVADLKLEFDELGKIRNNYQVNGLINDGQISILKKKLDRINFIFRITEKKVELNNIKLLLNDKNIFVPQLIGLREKNEIQVSGNLENKNFNFKEKEIKDYTNNEFLKKNFKEILFSSKSDFTFKIDKNFRFKNFDIKSNINLDYLKFKNFLKLKNNFPNIKDDIIFKNQKIKLEYYKDNLKVIGSGDIFLQEEVDIIKYNLTKNKKELNFDTNLNISKNPFMINLLDFEKNEKSNLDLSLKGRLIEEKLFFKKILISENENILSIENLRFSKNFKINDIGKIQLEYKDQENLKNQVQIIKDKRDYKITGNSFNVNKIVTELLNSNDKKTDLFNKDFKIFFDIKKIHLDKTNFTNNLEGFLLLNNNEITEVNLETKFSNNEIIKFTIKTSDNNEKITTLFSGNAKPLVDRYKFIKGFNEGTLDFYSIKKKNETKSTLKIYDFKLRELPVLTKILTLASLQGIADLLSGEGIRFNEFEMNFTNKKNLMTIEEIYALGPAISILMEGYIEKKSLISLRGTLVPATTINKTISSIPILGSILVGKKTGEGVFGVSFKIKGPPNNLETSVNPIKTLTPRFITRTLEKIKKIK